MPNKNEKALLKQAGKQFTQTTGIPIKIQTAASKTIRLQLEWQNQTHKLNGFLAPAVTPGNLGSVRMQLEQAGTAVVLITSYVNPVMAERLKQMNLPFIDTAGNVYLNLPPLYFYVKGNKLPNEVPAPVVRRVFRPAGLQIVFALLCNPGLEAQPLRTIAQKAGTALGTVAKVMQDLEAMRFLTKNDPGIRKLVNKKELLNRWVTAYPDHLRPKLILGYFKPQKHEWWKKVDLKVYQVFWGGEVAAWKLTAYLKPQRITLYAEHLPRQLLIDYKMKKVPEGGTEVLKKFWDFETENELVPPILVYADLLASGDARNIEAGKMIYEKEIAQYIRND